MHLRPAKFQFVAATDGLKDSAIEATLGNVRLQREERRTRAQPRKPLSTSKETIHAKPDKVHTTTPAQPIQREMTTMERLLEAKRNRIQEEVQSAQKERNV